MSAIPRRTRGELRAIEQEMDRPQKVDHRDSWRGMPPIRPGQPFREGRSGGPDPMLMPKAKAH